MDLTLWMIQLLERLARARPVFHSEADFQLALGWQIRESDSGARVRLETRPRRSVRLDMLVDLREGRSIAVELKYLTAAWSDTVEGEPYSLVSQGAQDIRGYDCVKDIQRVETFVADGAAQAGLVIVLTNDRSYWRDPGHGRKTNAMAFRLREGSVLRGTRTWGPLTGVGTTKGRIDPIELSGTYTCTWRDYSVLPTTTFRYALFTVDPGRP